MVLAGDLHLTCGAAGMVQAPVAIGKLEGSSTEGQTEDLMAKTDSEQGKLSLLQKLAGQGNAAGHGSGVSGSVGEKHPIGLMGHHLFEISVGGNDGDIATVGHKAIEDGPLDAEVNGDDMKRAPCPGFDALIESNRAGLRPAVVI